MKRILVCFVLLTACSQVLAQDSEIRKLVAEYSGAWNTHDAAAVARFYSEDADVVAAGKLVRGREAIQQMHAREFAAAPKDATITLRVEEIRTLDPGLTMIDGVFQVGEHPLAAHNGEGSTGNFSMLSRRTGDRWLIVAFRLFNDPRALCVAASEALAPPGRGTASQEPVRQVRGLGTPFTAEESASIVSKLLATPKIAERFRAHRTRALQVVEDPYPDGEKTPGGPTRRLASVLIFDYTAGEAWRFAYDPERSEVVREEALKGQPTPSQEERDEGARLLQAEARLKPLFTEGAVIEGGFNDNAPPGGNTRDRYLQFLLLSKDRQNLMRFVIVDLTTQKVAALLTADRAPQ